MQINKPLSGIVPSGSMKSGQSVASRPGGNLDQPGTPSAPRTDQVEISDAARRLAAQEEVGAGRGNDVNLSPVRQEVILSRIASGAYLSSEVAEQVARTIIDRSEL